MVKFNGEEWVAESTDETSEAGYPVINTLFRHGPKPFLTRIFQPNDYEQVSLCRSKEAALTHTSKHGLLLSTGGPQVHGR